MKKTIIAVIAIVLAIGVALTLYFTRYMKDDKDTEELYKQNIANVKYENTIETAIPQTELYNIVNEHFNSALPEGKTEKKAIIIGYDGCRADILAKMQSENSGIGAMLDDNATLKLTYCGGVNYPQVNTQDTSTAPGWCSVLTGQWADVHGITANDITKSLDTKTLLTTLTENKTIHSATFITKWAGHFSRNNATYLLEKDYCEENNLNVAFNKCKNNEASLKAALEEINQKDCADFTFVIYEQTDSAGHNFGFSFNNPKYKNGFAQVDSFGYETLEAIKARETYDTEDWLIIITSDHGGFSTDHGGETIQERMTFAVINTEF